ncbi:MAG: oxidoreductase, partial [Oricola sp.]|nr:oxidoreductase [Oricola sp.]
MSSFMPLTLFASIMLLTAASVALLVFPGRRPGVLPLLSESAALAALACAMAGVFQLFIHGSGQVSFLSGPLAIVIRLDAISATMTLLVAFIGWIVMRYARTYVDGEEREGIFHGLMLATLAAVLLLVQAGSLAVLVLAFLAVGIGLRRLLLFYPERAAARRAAAKFALVWHAGDVSLLLATGLFFAAFGT